MTIIDKVISYLGFVPGKDKVESALQDAGFTGDGKDTFDPSISETIVVTKKAAVGLMDLLLTTPDTTNENGYVIRYDRAAMLRYRNNIAGQLGLPEIGNATIKAPKVW